MPPSNTFFIDFITVSKNTNDDKIVEHHFFYYAVVHCVFCFDSDFDSENFRSEIYNNDEVCSYNLKSCSSDLFDHDSNLRKDTQDLFNKDLDSDFLLDTD